MAAHLFEQQLLEQLSAIEEIELSGFIVRAGLTGSGVALRKGRTYFGAWRVTAGTLVWSYANVLENNYFAVSVEDAVRHTMLIILRNLEQDRGARLTPHIAAAS